MANSRLQSGIGAALKGFVAGAQARSDIDKSRKTTSPSIKDQLLLGMAQQQGIIQAPQASVVAGAAGPVQAPTDIAQSFRRQAIAAGVDPIAFDNAMTTLGVKMSPGQKAQMGIVEDVVSQEAMRPGEVETAKQKAAAQKAGGGLSAEAAGRLAMLQQAEYDLDEVEGLLFDEDGGFKRLTAISSDIPLSDAPIIGGIIPNAVGEAGIKVASRIGNALNAKLRAETGAQANESEIKRLMNIFGISGFFDSAETARDKISRLKDFMQNSSASLDPQGNFVYTTDNTDLNNVLNQGVNEIVPGFSADEWEVV